LSWATMEAEEVALAAGFFPKTSGEEGTSVRHKAKNMANPTPPPFKSSGNARGGWVRTQVGENGVLSSSKGNTPNMKKRTRFAKRHTLSKNHRRPEKNRDGGRDAWT